MIQVMKYVAAKQGMKDDEDVLREIAEDANGNMRKALLVFEALKMQTCDAHSYRLVQTATNTIPIVRGTLSGPVAIAKPDWETYCHKVGDMIIAEQSPSRVMEVRSKLYELLSHCIPPTVILKVCLSIIPILWANLSMFSDNSGLCSGEGRRQHQSRYYALGCDLCMSRSQRLLSALIVHATQEVRMRQGNKKIFHLEAWVVKVMSIYKVSPADSQETPKLMLDLPPSTLFTT